MTVGWFFVPFANLFKPYQAVRDIWKASVPAAGAWQVQHASPLVGVWWGLWICSGIAGQAAFRITMAAETIETIRLAGIVRVVSGLVDLPLSALAMYLLYRLFVMQQEKYELLGSLAQTAHVCTACGEEMAPGELKCRVCGKELAANGLVMS